MCQGLTLEGLEANRILTLAFERCFEIIGEAIKRLPLELRDQYPQVAWKKAAGVRDLVIHNYDDIEHQVLLDAVRMHFPAMLDTIGQMLVDLGGELPAMDLDVRD